MPSQSTRGPIEAQRTNFFIGVVGATQFQSALQAIFRQRMRDAAGMYVHHTTDSTGSIQQGSGAFKYFNAVGNKGFNRSRVVGAGDRHIQGIYPVFHHAHAGAAQTVNYRPACRLSERRGADAGFSRHSVADGCLHLAPQFFIT